MKHRHWLSTGTLAALTVAATGAFAQETPQKTEDPKKGEEPKEDSAPVKWNLITVGYNSFKTNSVLSQYARPTEGLALHELKLFSPATETTPFARLLVRGMPNQDNLVDGYLVVNRGNTIIRGNRRQYQYYDFGWQPKASSEDNQTELTIDHSFGSGIAGFVSMKANERDGRYPAPRAADHNHTQVLAGGLGGNVLGGNLGVTLVDRRIVDNTGAQPTSAQRRIEATYSRDFGNALSLEGSAGYTRILQTGMADSSVRNYAFAGSLDLGPNTGLQFQFGQQDITLNNVLDAHVRKRLTSGARLMHRIPGWSFQFGYKHNETERVRADQTFVDVPKVNEYDARLAGKVGPARLTLRGNWQDFGSAPVVTTLDNRQLQWDDRTTLQAKVDGGGELFTAYGTYTYKYQRNKQRGVDIDWRNFAFGASYVLNATLNGYAEFSSDDFKVSGVVAGQSLQAYFPNARSIAAGLNWSKNQGLSASASLNYYESGDVRGTQLTFSMHKRMSADHELELVVAPWRREDRLLDMTGYQTTFVMARYTVKF